MKGNPQVIGNLMDKLNLSFLPLAWGAALMNAEQSPQIATL